MIHCVLIYFNGGLDSELERFKKFLTDLLHDSELCKAGERGCLLSVLPSFGLRHHSHSVIQFTWELDVSHPTGFCE